MRRVSVCVLVITACLALSVGRLSAQSAGDKAWSTLRSGLAEKGDDRIVAIRVLGLLENNPKAGEIATAALADEKPEVRAAAADALGQMRAKYSVPKLKDMIKTEKDPGVVIAGARSLIAMGDPLGYAVYYAVLTGQKKSGGGLLDDQKKMLNDPKKMANSASNKESGSFHLPV